MDSGPYLHDDCNKLEFGGPSGDDRHELARAAEA